MSDVQNRIQKRRTFAIISHPDAGKTTVTEKLLLLGGAIQIAGTVKARKSSRHATSDWMEIEKQRGISVTSSVMQFAYKDRMVNLLDTPGHQDFSEDTYRTLTAVDSALLVIDAAKGVEAQTIKLMNVCRMRNTPIITFINKLDREGRDPLELLDEIERILKIRCVPMTWPLGSGQLFQGLIDLRDNGVHLYKDTPEGRPASGGPAGAFDSDRVRERLDGQYQDLEEEIELVRDAGFSYDPAAYLAGEITPVFFGSALNNFGVEPLLDHFVEAAPSPLPREASERMVSATEEDFTGFVFKIQANMDPAHRDRIAFMRLCSGVFEPGMKLRHVRLQRSVPIKTAVSFMASGRDRTDIAYAGDIIGIHNHGTIQIGDTFSEGETLHFTGIPNFAPELFRSVVLKDPLKAKALLKGLIELSEEGASQIFRPLIGNRLIIGAVGVLQFDVVAWRLQHEYKVEASFESVGVHTARWIACDDPQQLKKFRDSQQENLALDGAGHLAYLAPTRVNLQLTEERWPDILFHATREH